MPIQIHKHRRKRIHQNLELYPHPKFKLRLLDYIVDVVVILLPLSVIPQIYEIWINNKQEKSI